MEYGWVCYFYPIRHCGSGCSPNQLVECGRYRRALRNQRIGRTGQLRGKHLLRIRACEGWLADQQLVGEDTECVDVGAMIDVRIAAACSGAMYDGVPMATPTLVTVTPVVASLTALATPESVTSAWRSDNMTLAGLTSRWTIPCLWQNVWVVKTRRDRDLAQESLRTDCRDQFWIEDFEGDPPLMPDVVRMAFEIPIPRSWPRRPTRTSRTT